MKLTKLVFASVAALSLGACGSSIEVGPPIIEGVAFVGMSVSDLDRSREILTSSANLSEVEIDSADSAGWGLTVNGVQPELSLLRGANSQFLLMAYPQTPSTGSAVPVEGPGIAHACFQVNQETRTYQRFQEHGATTIGEPELVQINPKNPVYYGYLHDPDSIVFEIEHVDVAALDLPEPPKNNYRVRQIALATPNMDRAVDFYSQLFSEPEPRRIGTLISLSGEKVEAVSGLAGAKLEMAWFQSRNLELELLEFKSHPTQRPDTPRELSALGFNMIVFDVSDLAQARERVVTAGGTLVDDRGEAEDRFFARDPDGNLLGFQSAGQPLALSSIHFPNNGT